MGGFEEGSEQEKVKKRRTLKTVCGKCETEVMHWVHYAAAGGIFYSKFSLLIFKLFSTLYIV